MPLWPLTHPQAATAAPARSWKVPWSCYGRQSSFKRWCTWARLSEKCFIPFNEEILLILDSACAARESFVRLSKHIYQLKDLAAPCFRTAWTETSRFLFKLWLISLFPKVRFPSVSWLCIAGAYAFPNPIPPAGTQAWLDCTSSVACSGDEG